MRVPADHLVGDVLSHLGETEAAFLLRHAGVVDHLEQQIAELVGKGGEVAAQNGVGHFVGFLDRVGGDGGKILLDIPRTASNRVAQRGHDVEQAPQCHGGRIGMRHSNVQTC